MEPLLRNDVAASLRQDYIDFVTALMLISIQSTHRRAEAFAVAKLIGRHVMAPLSPAWGVKTAIRAPVSGHIRHFIRCDLLAQDSNEAKFTVLFSLGF